MSLYPDQDLRVARIAAVVARVERATRAFAGFATRAAIAGGVGGLVLWWSTSGRDLHDGGQDAVVSLLVLALCLVPTGWLLNVRHTLLSLLRLPATLGEVTMRRVTQLSGATGPARTPDAAPDIGGWTALRSLRGMLRDYGDAVGSWAGVAQVVTPTFWAVTALALLAVPVLATVAAVTALIEVVA